MPYETMTWGEATQKYFRISPKSKVFFITQLYVFARKFIRFFPGVASAVLFADDVTVIGVADDVFIPPTLTALGIQIFWAVIRISWIHHRGNRS